MAAQLDGAGMAKMKTLEEALARLQHVHSLVERMAVALKTKAGIGVMGQQVKRAAVPLVGQLKGQFGMISDQVAGMILIAGRGGSEQMKVRALRESVAQIRTALELMQNKVKEQHKTEQDDATAGAE